jgi:outer membrane biogenesis lipoprotein LolB
MQKFIKVLLILFSYLIFTACSDETNNSNADAKKDHVWKETTDTIDRAKEVEGMMMDAAKNTQRAIEEQSE